VSKKLNKKVGLYDFNSITILETEADQQQQANNFLQLI